MVVKALFPEEIFPIVLYTPKKNSIKFQLQIINNKLINYNNLNLSIKCEEDIIILENKYDLSLDAQSQLIITIPYSGLTYSKLIKWTEKKIVEINLSLFHKDELLLNTIHSITIFPIDYFPGLNNYYCLPGFITPNHNAIYELKQKLIFTLQEHKKNVILDGYQSNDKERVTDVIAAVFTTLQKEKFIYSALPASFEQNGQRLRLIDHIAQFRFGNCIELSILTAALLEAIDLHPVIILTPGHAFVGCWLTPETFEHPFITSKNELLNRIAHGAQDILLFEATSICLGKIDNFKTSIAIARNMLITEQQFQAAVDIKLSRMLGYGAIPIDQATKSNDNNFTEELFATKISEDKIQLSNDNYIILNTLSKQELSKKNIWERKLLDLSLRNTLINLRPNSNCIQLINVDMSHLLSQLIDGKTLSISNSKALDIAIENKEIFPPIDESNSLYEYANFELKSGRLISLYSEYLFYSTLTSILRNYQTAIEESGSGSLYLSLGVLKWFTKDKPQQPRYAPILLIPIDIKRHSVLSKFTIKFRDEEVQINQTLIEYLKQEFKLDLSGLITYINESEQIDPSTIFNTIRKEIVSIENWLLEDMIFLANYNFKTQIIWQDIRENMEYFSEHPIINGLINKGYYADNKIDDTIIDTEKYSLKEHITPLTADTSQLQAIISANNGDSFVLHGPPGTGKSQTIANIIANFLYRNKTVLFVSAKKAALDVVHKRLVNIGLENFILELHSNKTKKSDVLLHLDNSLNQLKLNGNNQFEQLQHQTQTERDKLSNLQLAMHTKQACGFSIIELIELYHQNYIPSKIDKPLFTFNHQLLHSAHHQLIQNWLSFINDFVHEPLLKNEDELISLENIKDLDYYIGIENDIENLKESSIIDLKNNVNNLYKLNNNHSIITIKNLRILFELLEKISQHNSYNIAIIDKKFPANKSTFNDLINIYNQVQQLKIDVDEHFQTSIYKIDIDYYFNLIQKLNNSWFIPKLIIRRNLKKALKVHTKLSDLNITAIEHAIGKLKLIKDLEISINNKHNKLIINNLKNYKDEFIAIENLEKLIEFNHDFWHLVQQSNSEELIQKWIDNLNNNDSIGKLLNSFSEWKIAQSYLNKILNEIIPIANRVSEVITDDSIDGLLQKITFLKNNNYHINTWYYYLKKKNEGIKLGLYEQIKFIEKEYNKYTDINHKFKIDLYANMILFLCQNNNHLRTFSSNQVNSTIDNLIKLTELFNNEAKRAIYLNLLNNLPNTNYNQITNSELTILQRAIRSRGRNKSLRTLFKQTKNILPKVAPCMLMSPISVAQYLDIDTNKFDLVIFDEASQLPTAEAISSIARAKQTIIVGDPKQMPPTSFFASNKDEEDIEWADLESILEDSLSINVPSKYLLHHYRSQHESLIAFSNQQFYDNKLYTFPSADDLASKVTWIHVPGYYDKGKSRQNKFEAVAIVEEVLHQLQLPDATNKSLGIVTFSQTQQQLIEDLLEDLYKKQPEIESIAQQLKEPIFVKNLENVQGDERDLILFSIGYAPDKEGQMSMNFGPLNQEGGWRRLNVAITRAKYEMKVFSTLLPQEIDTGKTDALGVRALKSFLEFAQYQKNKILSYNAQSSTNSIINEINDFIMKLGYTTALNIGQSHLKIDIAIKHPKNEEYFMLGIMLDHEELMQSGNVYDRNILIPRVLNRLNWNLYRIWTVDYHFNSDNIYNEITTLLTKLSEEEPNIYKINQTIIDQEISFKQNDITDLPLDNQQSLTNVPNEYNLVEISPVSQFGAEAMLHSRNKAIVTNQIIKLVIHEAPINIVSIIKRLQQIWNISRTGARIERYIDKLIEEQNFHRQLFQEQIFIWKNAEQATNFTNFRTANTNYRRTMEDIAPQEYCAALADALLHHGTISKEDSYKFLQKILIGGRTTSSSCNYIAQAIEEYGPSYQIINNQENYQLKKI